MNRRITRSGFNNYRRGNYRYNRRYFNFNKNRMQNMFGKNKSIGNNQNINNKPRKVRPIKNNQNINFKPRGVNKYITGYMNRVRSYAYAVLHPEKVYRQGILIKQPSLFPTPSAVVSFMESVKMDTEHDGWITGHWTPNFLCDNQTLPNSESKYCHFVWQNYIGSNYHESRRLQVNVTSYRLVCARMDIIFIGKLLTLSGQMSGCMTTTDRTVYTFGTNSPTVGLNITMDQCRNGMWSQTRAIKSGLNMSFRWVPMDATDNVFYKINKFYGDDQTTVDQTAHITYHSSTEGAHSAYIFRIEGLSDEDTILANFYYVFEVMPTTDTAPILRVNQAATKSEVVTGVLNVINKERLSGKLISK